MTANSNNNYWVGDFQKALNAYIKANDTSASAVATFCRDVLSRYIDARVQDGAIVWRPESEQARADVALRVMELLNVDSLKGLKKDYEKLRKVKAYRQRITRAVEFYAACSLLADKTGHGPIWDKLFFPVVWVYDEDRDNALELWRGNKDGATFEPMLPIKTDSQDVSGVRLDGSIGPVSVRMTAQAILKASGVVATPARKTAGSQAAAPVTNAASTATQADAVASFLAKADGKPIRGEMANALEPLIQQLVANETLWQLALAERDAYLKAQQQAVA